MLQEDLTFTNRPVWQVRLARPPAHLPNWLATLNVALTIGILAFSSVLGSTSILAMYLLWLPMLLTGWRPLLRGLKRNRLVVLYTALCLVSVVWSDYRLVTLRAALETISMILCTLIMVQRTSLRAFLRGLILGATGVLVITLLSGIYGMDYFNGTYSLIGWLGSKNIVGLFAELTIFSALLYFFAHTSLHSKIFYALIPGIIGLYCLYISRSATSEASLLILLILIGATWFLTKVPGRQRAPVAFIGSMLALVILITGFYAGWHEAVFGLFGKNTTLTGRTYLWNEGFNIGLQRPWLGHGYSAFWVPGQLQAERYWYEFGIAVRSGFHFHNMYVQSFVDLGVGGFLLFAMMYINSCIQGFYYLFRYKIDLTAFFSIGLSILFLVRSMVEVDLLTSFGIGPLLFFSIIPRLNEAEDAHATLTDVAQEA